jgi:phage terminase small subunit
MKTLTRQITRPEQLTPRQRQRFVEEYLLDNDVGAAAQRAGIPAPIAASILGKPKTQHAIRDAKAERISRTQIYADEVLRRWYMLSTADVREIVAVLRVNCRHCCGVDHHYQFTADELRLRRMKGKPFDDHGGDGFNPWGDPHPDCTECGGEGVPTVWIADSRTLSPGAAMLYDGVEEQKEGMFRVKMRDRGYADQMVAAHLGIGPRRGGGVTVNGEQQGDVEISIRLVKPEPVDGAPPPVRVIDMPAIGSAD